MKLRCTVLLCSFISLFTMPATESYGRRGPRPPIVKYKRGDNTAEQHIVDDGMNPVLSEKVLPSGHSHQHPNSHDQFHKLLVKAEGNFDPVYLSKNTGSSTGDGCDREKIQQDWTMRVSKFHHQLEDLESLIRISVEDLTVHLENGTVEDSWVGQLVEHGKHLTAIHKDHHEHDEPPVHIVTNLQGNTRSQESSSTGDACDREKLQQDWTTRVSKFHHQLDNFGSLIRISVEDLIVHLKNGTVDDSWVGELVEYGKQLKVLHKDHDESKSKGDGCDREKVQQDWTTQVSKFQLELKNLQSLIRISIEDLLVHLETKTVDDSWVEELVENGKLLKTYHKDHNEREVQPESIIYHTIRENTKHDESSSTGDACDREKIQHDWTMQVTKFQNQLENLGSLVRISVEDLMVHLKNGTVDDSWVEELVEYGKKVLHKDHKGHEEAPVHVDPAISGNTKHEEKRDHQRK